jgi:hypothetical protein
MNVSHMKELVRKAVKADAGTLSQRTYLADLYERLGWSLPAGWRDMSRAEISKLIDNAAVAVFRENIRELRRETLDSALGEN